VNRSYLGQTAPQEFVELLGDLCHAETSLKFGDDVANVGDQRTLVGFLFMSVAAFLSSTI
jgi:hypothetical protein